MITSFTAPAHIISCSKRVAIIEGQFLSTEARQKSAIRGSLALKRQLSCIIVRGRVYTHWSSVDEDDQEDHQQDNDHAPNDVPLVVLPDDVFEGLQRRREPEEGGGWAVGLLQMGVQVRFVSGLGRRLQQCLFLGQNLYLQFQLTLGRRERGERHAHEIKTVYYTLISVEKSLIKGLMWENEELRLLLDVTHHLTLLSFLTYGKFSLSLLGSEHRPPALHPLLVEEVDQRDVGGGLAFLCRYVVVVDLFLGGQLVHGAVGRVLHRLRDPYQVEVNGAWGRRMGINIRSNCGI